MTNNNQSNIEVGKELRTRGNNWKCLVFHLCAVVYEEIEWATIEIFGGIRTGETEEEKFDSKFD